MSMNNGWLPTSVEAGWIAIYLCVLLAHAHHAWNLSGRDRLWHISHIVMSLGMIDMFWPTNRPVGERAGEVVFALASVLALAVGVHAALHAMGWRAWVPSTVDLTGMVYMFAMMSHRTAGLTLVFVAWSLLEAILWASGYAFLALRLDPSDAASVDPHGAGTSPGINIVQSPATSPSPTTTLARATTPATVAGADHGWNLRLTLTAMTLGMAYMFLVMQYGMAGMGHMTGM